MNPDASIPRDETRRILILGDSNCLPRRDGKYHECWVSKLQQARRGDEFVMFADGGRTSGYLALHPRPGPQGVIEYDPCSLEMFEPSIVILNLGIVDCSPRLFAFLESRVLGTLPALLRTFIIAAAKRVRRRSMRRAYVKLADFERNFRQYFERCGKIAVSRVVVLGIPTPDQRCVRKNPQIQQAVAMYNRVLADLARADSRIAFINPLVPEQEHSILYVEDGYHLSNHGHMVVFEAITQALAR